MLNKFMAGISKPGCGEPKKPSEAASVSSEVNADVHDLEFTINILTDMHKLKANEDRRSLS